MGDIEQFEEVYRPLIANQISALKPLAEMLSGYEYSVKDNNITQRAEAFYAPKLAKQQMLIKDELKSNT